MLSIEIMLKPLVDPNVTNRYSGHITIRDPNTLDIKTSKFFDINNPAALKTAIGALISAELTAAGVVVT